MGLFHGCHFRVTFRQILYFALPESHADQSAVQYTALTFMAIYFRSAVIGDQLRRKAAVKIQFLACQLFQKEGAVAAQGHYDTLRGETAKFFTGHVRFQQQVSRHGVCQPHLFPQTHIAAEINPPLIVIDRRHSGNQTAVALHGQRKFGNIIDEIFIGCNLQVMLINIRGRHAVQLGHAGIAHHFRDLKFLADGLPAQHIIPHHMQVFATERRHDNPRVV